MKLTREEFNELVQKQREARLHMANPDKQKLREELEAQMQEFLAKGGKITDMSINQNKIDKPDFNQSGALKSMRKHNSQRTAIKQARVSQQKPYLDAYYEKFGAGSWSELSRKTGGLIKSASISKCYYGTASIMTGWDKLKQIIIDELGMDVAA